MKMDLVKKMADFTLQKNVNSACLYVLHQPKLPKGAVEKYRKLDR